MVVTDFLVEHFGDILNYNFTAEVEQQFDEIANGMKEWTEMIKNFYDPFHKTVEDTLEHSERASGERYLGEHPKTGEKESFALVAMDQWHKLEIRKEKKRHNLQA